MNAVLLPANTALAGALGWWFLRCERRGRPVAVVLAILALVVVEATLYATQDVPPSILRVDAGPVRFRLPELLIGMALAARASVQGLPHRTGLVPLWWSAFVVWLLAAAVVGTMAGHDVDLVLFEARVVLYLGGGFALAAGVPAVAWTDDRALPRLVRWSAVAAAVPFACELAGVTVTAPLPLVPLVDFGQMGADAASIFVALGVIGLAMEVCRARRRLATLVASGVLLLSPLGAYQRAALLGLGVALAVLAAACLGRTARRRVRVTPTESALVALAIVGLLTLPQLLRAGLDEPGPLLPVADDVLRSFTSEGKQQSAQSRSIQLAAAMSLVIDRPWTGSGLGTTYTYFEPGPDEVWESNITHNVVLDLALRTGVVGVLLFGVAVGSSLLDGARAWRDHADDVAAALALACVAAVCAVLAKGLFESVLEKYRLATLLGLLLGVTRAAAVNRFAPGPVTNVVRLRPRRIASWN